LRGTYCHAFGVKVRQIGGSQEAGRHESGLLSILVTHKVRPEVRRGLLVRLGDVLIDFDHDALVNISVSVDLRAETTKVDMETKCEPE